MLSIQEHYSQEAATHGSASTSTMADVIIRQKETAAIIEFVRNHLANGPKDQTILDVGCGNGYMLSQLRRFGCRLIGVEQNRDLRELAKSHGDIREGDVTKRETLPSEQVDVLICQRVIINILDEHLQAQALDNIVSLVKAGGSMLFIEAFRSGWQNLNDARAEMGLPSIPVAFHNRYLEDDFFNHPAIGPLQIDSPITPNMLSTHYFVARVLHPALCKSDIRNSHFVRFLSTALPDGIGDYCSLRVMMFYKK